MSLLKKVNSGIKIGPQFHVVMGTEGVGKSTWASKFPNTLFADIEDGSKHINTTRLSSSDLPNYESLVTLVDELLTTKHSYETLVIDSITTLENYIQLNITKGKCSIVEALGGYGKGHDKAREILSEFTLKLKDLQNKKNMTIILVGHVQVKSFHDPLDNDMYDRYVVQSNEKFAQIIKSQSDNVFFCKNEVTAYEDDKTKKKLAQSSGKRIMITEWRTGADAKNRLNLPYELPLDYNAFVKACKDAHGVTGEDLITDIKEVMKGLDEEVRAKVEENLKANSGDVNKLKLIKQRAIDLSMQ